MRRAAALLPLAPLLCAAAPLAAQETRALLVLEGEPGYLTNAYLEPVFPAWDPDVDAAFATLGATGVLEWRDPATALLLAAGGRWTPFADSTPAWRSALLRGRAERSAGRALALGLEGSWSDVRQRTPRRTAWFQGYAAWTPSPRLRLRFGPGVAIRRFPGADPAQEDGPGGGPPIPPVDAGGGDRSAAATSVLGFVAAEAWAGRGWRLEASVTGSRTESPDLGLDYHGVGGAVRAARSVPGGVRLEAGLGVEGFGFRAAPEGGATEVPERGHLWRGELGLGWPLGGRAEVRGRLAGLYAPGADGGRADAYASVGLRVVLGGVVSSGARRRPSWTRTADGVRLRVPYRGSGRLYVTGDFNGWADPGAALSRAGEGTHAVVLRLPPGVYRYRIRVVGEGQEEWLELPDAATEDDGFGGRNGVLVVSEGGA